MPCIHNSDIDPGKFAFQALQLRLLTQRWLPQVEWGVRIDELHQVSTSAAYIHPAVAKKLQDLWDEGSNLLSLLDDRCGEAHNHMMRFGHQPLQVLPVSTRPPNRLQLLHLRWVSAARLDLYQQQALAETQEWCFCANAGRGRALTAISPNKLQDALAVCKMRWLHKAKCFSVSQCVISHPRRSWEALTTISPNKLQDGLAVLREAEAARLSRQQAVAMGAAPPGVEADVQTVNTALQV